MKAESDNIQNLSDDPPPLGFCRRMVDHFLSFLTKY